MSDKNGRTIEEMALDEPTYDATGTQPQLSLLVENDSGLEVKYATLKVKLPRSLSTLFLQGQYRQGDRVSLTIEAEVGPVVFDPIKDPKVGYVTGLVRQHVAVVDGVTVH